MDDVLPLIGKLGKFQILLQIAFYIMNFPGSMLVLIPYFVQHNPPWMCVANSTVCRLNGTYDTQSKFYEERCKMPRSEWQFTKAEEYSIMTQVSLDHRIRITKFILILCLDRNGFPRAALSEPR